MNHSRLHFFLFSLMSLVATSVFADETKAILPEKEEDIPVEFIPTLDTTISVGLRRLNNGPHVRFGNLGSFSQPVTGSDQEKGANFVSHSYTDGYVLKDAMSIYEQDENGNLLGAGPVNGDNDWRSVRTGDVVTVYQSMVTAVSNVADANGIYMPKTKSVETSPGVFTEVNDPTWASAGKFLIYDANRARTWGTLNKSQVFEAKDSNGNVLKDASGKPLTYVRMNADGVVSAGAALAADSSASTGFDISVERRLGKRGHLEWGVSAGCKFAYINAKAAGVFPAYLLRTTDTYKLNTSFNGNLTLDEIDHTQPGGNAKSLTYYGLDVATGVQGTSQLYKYVDSTTAPETSAAGQDTSNATPIDLTDITWGTPTIVGVVMVHGNYQLKGAYLLAHVGPTFRYNLNDRWAVSGTFGLAAAWVGTTFTATEFYNTWNDVFTLDGVTPLRPDLEGNTTEYHITESNATHKFTPGLYCDLNLEYWVTDRTGFYAGFTGQSMRKYNQSQLSGRTATVDMGKNTGWTLGIRTRF